MFDLDLKDPFNLPTERPTHREGALLGFIGGEEVESIGFYGKRLVELEAQIYMWRTSPNDAFQPNNSAFVSFEKIIGAHDASRKLSNKITHKIQSLVSAPPSVKLSPPFEDIIWENISIDAKAKTPRQLLGIGITAALILSYTFLLTTVYAMSNLEKWSKLPGVGQKLSQNKFFVIFLQSYFSPLVTIIFNILVPIVLRRISRIQGVLSEGGVERSTLNKFFGLLIYQFIGYLSGGIVDSTIQTIFGANPANKDLPKFDVFVRIMGDNFIKNANYYAAITVTSYTSQALEILQAAPLIMKYLNRHFLSSTPRQRYEASESPKFDYMSNYGLILFQFFNCLAYSVTAPYMNVVAVVFFWMAYLIMKYQVHYVYETKSESGGAWFPPVFFLMCLCLAGFQLTTFGAVVILAAYPSSGSNGKTQSLAIAMTMVLTALFWLYIRVYVQHKAEFVSKKQEDVAFAEIDEPARPEDDLLQNRVFNPCLVKPLPTVWVNRDAQSILDQMYRPEYRDLLDFVRKNRPEMLSKVEAQEQERRDQIATLERRETQKRQSIHQRLEAEADLGSQEPLTPGYDGIFESYEMTPRPL